MFESVGKTWQEELDRLRGLNITEAVRALTDLYHRRYDMSPDEINNGMCWDFADDLKVLLPEAAVTNNCEIKGLPLDAFDGGWHHAFIELDGRYYDSETPEGVTDWMELPCCRRCTCT